MTAYEIPTAPRPQRFTISLGGTVYNLKLSWCDPAACWILDIADAGGALLLAGIPLVTSADLLEQYGYLGFPGELRVQTDGAIDAVPTYENLGTRGHLYFVTQ
jgi:hypothetical protein